MFEDNEMRFLFLLDNSGSMYGEKISALNQNMFLILASFRKQIENMPIECAILSFGGKPEIHHPFQLITELKYIPLEAGGKSSLTEGLELARTIIHRKDNLVLLSDGMVTDRGFIRKLDEIFEVNKKFALPIGFAADKGMLERFTGNPAHVIAPLEPGDLGAFLINTVLE